MDTEIGLSVHSAPQNAINIFHMHTTWSHRQEKGLNKMSAEKYAGFCVANEQLHF